jgi:hypothetical protein
MGKYIMVITDITLLMLKEAVSGNIPEFCAAPSWRSTQHPLRMLLTQEIISIVTKVAIMQRYLQKLLRITTACMCCHVILEY